MISLCVRYPDGSQDGLMIKELFWNKNTLSVVTIDGNLMVFDSKKVKNFELGEIKK